MPIPEDLSTPVFSYVGRLRDSRKGLDLFLDALAILWARRPARQFKVWVIGGDADDKAWALSLAACRPTLKDQLLSGDLIFWGRIENSALPEFYSRTMALVVPSFREQFCLAAVEAMMCGCPVIAARTGGLQSVVVDGRTGSLFERGNSASLAGVLASYLETPSLAAWLGQNASLWARSYYDADEIYPALTAALADIDATGGRWSSEPRRAFNGIIIPDLIPVLEDLLARRVSSFEDVSSSHCISFMITLADETKAFVKFYSDRPTDFTCLHRTEFPGDSHRLSSERLTLALHLNGQAFFPSVLACDLEKALLVQEWVPAPASFAHDDKRAALRLASAIVQSFDPAPETLATREEVYRELSANRTVNGLLLSTLDRLVAQIHSPLIGGAMRTRRFHPQLELFRLNDLLSADNFWLPRGYTVRAQANIALLLSIAPLIATHLKFAHGTLKQEHLLNEKPLLCDFDAAGYFCGPIDVAHWTWEYFLCRQGSHPGPMLRQLRKELGDRTAVYLGACWLLEFQISRDLIRFSRGSWPIAHESMTFLFEFPDAFRAVHGATRLRESDCQLSA